MTSSDRNIKKVIIVPSDINHHEFYQIMACALKRRYGQIIILAREEIVEILKDELGDDKIEYVLRGKDETLFNCMKMNRKCIATAHSIIFDEPYESIKYIFLAFLVLKKINKILIMHNVNRWFSPDKPKTFGALLIKITKHYIVRGLAGAVVMNSRMKKNLSDVHGFRKRIFCLPFSLPISGLAKRRFDPDNVTIAVPGMLDVSRRDYGTLVASLEKISIRNNKRLNVRIVGYVVKRAENMDIVARFDAINAKNGPVHIDYWNERLPNKTFAKEIMESDIILSNINVDYQDINTKERYRITKESGTTFLMLKYAKPGIIPQEFLMRDELEGQYWQYSDADELAEIFRSLLLGTIDVEQLNKRSLDNSKKYAELAAKQLTAFAEAI